jgi:hypothetical protein
MWVESIMQNAPGANTPGKQIGALVFGVLLTVAGVVQLKWPLSLPTLLRFKSKEGDMRLYYADAFERSPWKGRLVGGLAILWGLLFVALMANMLLHPGQ